MLKDRDFYGKSPNFAPNGRGGSVNVCEVDMVGEECEVKMVDEEWEVGETLVVVSSVTRSGDIWW